ncbi:MAG: ABC transporter permease [Woeseia sp.]|nr:ABC transporter permease [Gammaproteobacteria bacterium]NNE60385.1 ABC transporter permease [Woeseia sp.]
MYAWTAGVGTGIYATVRMLVQLLAVGFVLVFIFESVSPVFIAGVVAVMLLVASSIAVRPIPETSWRSYGLALIAITLSSVATLALVTQSVIGVEPWFSPRYIVPLAGMIIAGAMNAISLAGERMHVELSRGEVYEAARRTAFKASIIPITNSLFAVGIVALPGMMTGQILSGVSPLVAVKYQIVVMNMLFGATGAASALYLTLCKHYEKQRSAIA